LDGDLGFCPNGVAGDCATLAFSTLRKSLTAREKTEITRITRVGRKPWKADHPLNPVLILTGTELLSWQGPPYCWDEALRKQFDIHGMLRLTGAVKKMLPFLNSSIFS
jgi:hypothetical protein